MHNTVVIVYKGLSLKLKPMDLSLLMPIKAPTAVRKKAHSFAISSVNNGRVVTPSLVISLPLLTTMSRNKPKARAR